MKKFDRDFFAIEEDKMFGKRIHVYAYAYESDEASDTPYRLMEFTFFYIPVGLSPEEFWKSYDRGLDRTKHYVGHYNEADINDILDNYFDVEPTALAYDEISYDTPCGFYIQA